MIKGTVKTTFLITALLVSGFSLAWCTGAFNARDLADALASDYEDWFDVDGGETVEGEPPAEDEDGQPAILSFEAPVSFGPTAAVDYGLQFSLMVHYDLAAEADIRFVLIHVTQANKDDEGPSYIRVPFVAGGGTQEILTRINWVQNLQGNAFRIRLGLQGQNGLVGNWVDWNTVMEEPMGEITRLPMCPEPDSFLSNYEGCYTSIHENEETGQTETIIDCYTANVFLRGACAAQFHHWDLYSTLDGAFRSTNIGFFDTFSMGWPAGTRWPVRDVWLYDEVTHEPYSMPVDECWIEINCHDKTTSIPFNSKEFIRS